VAPHCNDFLLRILGFHAGGYEEFYFLGYNAVESVESHPTFKTNVVSLSSGLKYKPSKKPELAASFRLLSCLAYYSTMKTEVTYFSETSDDFQRTIRRYKPEDKTLISICSFINPTDRGCDVGSICVKSQIFRDS
jgi:hypothetical protein